MPNPNIKAPTPERFKKLRLSILIPKLPPKPATPPYSVFQSYVTDHFLSVVIVIRPVAEWSGAR